MFGSSVGSTVGSTGGSTVGGGSSVGGGSTLGSGSSFKFPLEISPVNNSMAKFDLLARKLN